MIIFLPDNIGMEKKVPGLVNIIKSATKFLPKMIYIINQFMHNSGLVKCIYYTLRYR